MSFPRNNNPDSRYSYSNYYAPKVKNSDFNVLIDGKSLFDLPVNHCHKIANYCQSDNYSDTSGSLWQFKRD